MADTPPLDELGAIARTEDVLAIAAYVDSERRAPRRAAALARLRRAVAAGERGPASIEAVFALVRLSDVDAARGESAAALETYAARVGGSPGAIAHAAALLVEDRTDALAAEMAQNGLLVRHAPQAYLHLRRVPPGASALFATWQRELERGTTHLGSTAYRAFLGDVAEAAFRALQHGADATQLLGEDGRAFFVDAACAELGGTTDFVAARAMAWLLGALAQTDETARAAIERARTRFHAPAFQRDCATMLAGDPWPPTAATISGVGARRA
jgi:hypothetical protein